MKSFKKIFVFFSLVVALIGLTGCFTTDDNSFEIESYPKTTYVKGETFDWSEVSVKINGVSYSYEQAKAVKEVEFPVITIGDAAGTFSATIKYQSLTATFQYTVLDSYFANGNGTLYNPYQISTVEQLKQSLKQHNEVTYYVLINDVECDEAFSKNDFHVANYNLDGQGYKISLKGRFIDFITEYCTLENIDFDFNVENGGSHGIIYISGLNSSNTEVYCKNINIFGSVKNITNNQSIFGYVWGAFMCLENVNNYMYIDAHNASYTGIFTTAVRNNGVLVLLNTKNYGTVIAGNCGLFAGNGSDTVYKGNKVIIDSASGNYGDIITLYSKNHLFFANVNSNKYNVEDNGTLTYKEDQFQDHYDFYKYNADKGLDASKYDETDSFDITVGNSSDLSKFAVVDSRTLEFEEYNIKEENGEYVLTYENTAIAKANKIEISILTSYSYYYVDNSNYNSENGTYSNVVLNGITTGGSGPSWKVYSNVVESTTDSSAMEKLNTIFENLKAYKIANLSTTYSRPDNKYNLDSEYQFVEKVENSELSLYKNDKDEYVYVVEPKLVKNNDGQDVVQYSASYYSVSITFYDNAGNFIGSKQLLINN